MTLYTDTLTYVIFELWINGIWFVLDQHAVLDCQSARSLKQQFRGSHDTLHGHINICDFWTLD
jgi:hypothetical protein